MRFLQCVCMNSTDKHTSSNINRRYVSVYKGIYIRGYSIYGTLPVFEIHSNPSGPAVQSPTLYTQGAPKKGT